MCVEYERRADWLPSAVVRNVTHLSTNATSTEISYEDLGGNGFQDPYVSTDCTGFETAYQTASPGSEINKGAYSPWIYMLNIDHNR